ncbi:unnamed protein product, partial [Phaeothamnion confervicola]
VAARRALGEEVVAVRLAADPLPPPPLPPPVPRFPVRICLVGGPCAGKSEQARRLAAAHGLKVLSAAALLAEAVAVLDCGREAMVALAASGLVPDDVYARLVQAAFPTLSPSRQPQQPQWRGWVLDDFPSTATKALALERRLSGYDDARHVDSAADKESPLAPLGLTAPPAATVLPPAGVDLLILLRCAPETSVRRCLGRRVDPATGAEYHMEGNLPPYEDACKARLVAPPETLAAAAALAERTAAHEAAEPALAAAGTRFGTLKTVAADRLDPDALFAALSAMVGEVERAAAAAATAAEAAVMVSAETATKPAISAEAGSKQSLVPRGSCSSLGSAPTASGGSDDRSIAGAALPAEVATVLARQWTCAEAQYVDGVRRCCHELRTQRRLAAGHVRAVRAAFTALLAAPDDKTAILATFVRDFNTMPQDMRFTGAARAELGLRLEGCRDALWRDLEGKDAAVRAALQEAEEDGWARRQAAQVHNHFAALMQCEVDRFHASVALLLD